MNSRRVLLAPLFLLSGALTAQDLNQPDGFRVVKVQGVRVLAPIGDVNSDGIDDLGKVNPRETPATGNCLLVVPGALAHTATITPATSGGQFCSDGNSNQALGRALFGTNFCGVGTRSVAFGYNNYHSGLLYTMPRTGVVGWQTILVCNGTNEKVISKLGDLNGDGTDDLWLGTSGGGSGWLRFGKRPENPVTFCDHSAPAPSNITCDGQVIRRLSGAMSDSAYRLGNLGGDSGIDLGFTGSGTFFGLFSFASDDLNAITPEQGFKMTSSSGGISSVVGDIDLNADGMLDVVIGFEGADSAGLSSNGRVYIVYGRAGGFPFETDLDSPQQDVVRLDGVSSLEFLGRHMTALDFDGDGIDDVVVPGATGSIYVLFGRTGRFSVGPITATSYQSARIAAPTGQIASLSSDFDFNDDGIEDFGINGPSGQDDYYVVLGRSNGLFSDSFE